MKLTMRMDKYTNVCLFLRLNIKKLVGVGGQGMGGILFVLFVCLFVVVVVVVFGGSLLLLLLLLLFNLLYIFCPCSCI